MIGVITIARFGTRLLYQRMIKIATATVSIVLIKSPVPFNTHAPSTRRAAPLPINAAPITEANNRNNK